MSFGIKKIDVRLEEPEIIQILINWGKDNRDNTLRPFDFMIYSPLDMDEPMVYKGFYVAHEIQRTEMGFDPKNKPGDFDVIIIPYSDEQIYFNRTAVFEIKVVRPTRDRPQKNANKLGVSELNGLIKDGFPLVSLMHISMTEPLQDHEKQIVPFSKHPVSMDEPLKNTGEKWNDTINVYWDWFGMLSADKQMKRLIANDIPKYAGLCCASLSCHGPGDYSLGTCTQDFWHFQHGYFNPHTRPETIDRVKEHFEKYRFRYQDKKK